MRSLTQECLYCSHCDVFTDRLDLVESLWFPEVLPRPKRLAAFGCFSCRLSRCFSDNLSLRVYLEPPMMQQEAPDISTALCSFHLTSRAELLDGFWTLRGPWRPAAVGLTQHF